KGCLERGESVEDRARTVAGFFSGQPLREDSNVQFGEGGAGAFSDGKLTTGIKDPRCRTVLREFADHGAPEDILTLAHPHIGTDRLPAAVLAIRREIEALGGTVLFRTRLTGLQIEKGKLTGVILQGPDGRREVPTSCLLAAVGHSAADTQEMFLKAGLTAVAKPFSIGFRIEHRQAAIDLAQYGRFAGHPSLPPAEYKLHARLPDGRGVYTFCMCPGGTVAAAASRQGGVCVNGMSPYLRDGENANAAVLVDVNPEDFGAGDLLAGFRFQRELEEKAFLLGGENYNAPAQRVEDYLSGRLSADWDVRPSYRPGVTAADLNRLFPAPWNEDLKTGLRLLDRQLHGFAAPGAVLTAVETRSSCPLRFPRDERMESGVRGVILIGEGAGYAGGIMSAAVDGIHCAETAAAAM
ncbi:MAG: hypothetical protein IJ240_02030, partial [Clostridia bacterium]|nr:hypothetical protein [Clostridia bacterium]